MFSFPSRNQRFFPTNSSLLARAYASCVHYRCAHRYTCSNNVAQQFNLNADGQIIVGGGNLCVSATGSNVNYPFVLATCDSTQAAQIFTPQCPPSPPPPVAVAVPPCNGGPSQYTMTVGAKQLCLTSSSGYSLEMLPCSTGDTSQLFTGINTNTVQVITPLPATFPGSEITAPTQGVRIP